MSKHRPDRQGRGYWSYGSLRRAERTELERAAAHERLGPPGSSDPLSSQAYETRLAAARADLFKLADTGDETVAYQRACCLAEMGEALVRLGRLIGAFEPLSEAEAILADVPDRSAMYAAVLAWKAYAAEQLGENTRAFALIDAVDVTRFELPELRPLRARFISQRLWLLVKLRQWPRVVDEAQAILDDSGDTGTSAEREMTADAHSCQAVAAWATQQPDLALAAIDRALEAHQTLYSETDDPNQRAMISKGLYLRANALDALGERRAAAVAFREFIRDSADDPASATRAERRQARMRIFGLLIHVPYVQTEEPDVDFGPAKPGVAESDRPEHAGPHFVTILDLRKGLTVEYLGDDDSRGILDEELLARHVRIFRGHPGRIWFPKPPHVMVHWVGLEDEPASFAVGFARVGTEPDHRTPYPGLGLISEDEYQRRHAAMTEALADGADLAEWKPPWEIGRSWGGTGGAA